MKKEDADKIKCDRCGCTAGLHQHAKGWRCSECAWKELEKIVSLAETVVDSSSLDYSEGGDGYHTVFSDSLSDLEDAVDEFRSSTKKEKTP